MLLSSQQIFFVFFVFQFFWVFGILKSGLPSLSRFRKAPYFVQLKPIRQDRGRPDTVCEKINHINQFIHEYS
jgi:hypothetical protein